VCDKKGLNFGVWIPKILQQRSSFGFKILKFGAILNAEI
jgi:hypothetical protein